MDNNNSKGKSQTNSTIMVLFLMLSLSLYPFMVPVSGDDDGNETGRALGDTPWPMMGNNPQLTGLSDYSTEGNDGVQKWKYHIGFMVDTIPVIGADNTIYFGGYDGFFYAMNPDGSLKWKYNKTEECTTITAAIGDDGTIYFGGYGINRDTWEGEANMYALNPDGSLKWKTRLERDIASGITLDQNGTLYFTSSDYHLYAMDSSGEITWTWNCEWGDSTIPFNTPSIGPDGSIYMSAYRKGVFGFNTDHTEKFNQGAGKTRANPVIDDKGNIYIGGDEMLSLEPDGDIRWNYSVNLSRTSSPAIGPDGNLYFLVTTRNATSLISMTTDGELIWQYNETDPWPYFMWDPVISANGDVFFFTAGKVLGVKKDGTLKWRFDVNNHVRGVTIAKNGAILFGSHNDYFYCIGGGEFPAQPPGPPTNLLTLGGDGWVNLTWTPPQYDGGSIITGYKILRGETPTDLTVISEVQADTLFYNDNTVTNGKTYYYDVKAKNKAGDGDQIYDNSEPPPIVPKKKTDFTNPIIEITEPLDGAILTDPEVTVKGTASDNIEVLKVEISIDNENWTLTDGKTTWSKQVTLEEGKNTIYIRATDTAGNTEIEQTDVTVGKIDPPGTDPVTGNHAALMLIGVLLLITVIMITVMWAVLHLRRKGP
jgi:hypothetical protein